MVLGCAGNRRLRPGHRTSQPTNGRRKNCQGLLRSMSGARPGRCTKLQCCYWKPRRLIDAYSERIRSFVAQFSEDLDRSQDTRQAQVPTHGAHQEGIACRPGVWIRKPVVGSSRQSRSAVRGHEFWTTRSSSLRQPSGWRSAGAQLVLICRNYNKGACGPAAAQGKCVSGRSHQCSRACVLRPGISS